ncbi:MAG: prepilin-type N-terminal cleavage/methylation domain-containing protein [Comamonadaceae bacterium]|nr:prepilin-type N-terminal cleavage/methylation domain-containing protein [Burkholderiales bacterium]MEB2347016.1 prepilin-type N-terminal cleavage/methylation domain-containing protein [Comamonadaceae bacterium]
MQEHKALPRGFTLVELLVAIAILALLAVVSWRGLDGMVRSQTQTGERTDALLTLQTVLDQWGTDLDALEPLPGTTALAWDGQVLRLTRRSARADDAGAIVVAWARRNVDGTDQWLRWQSPPVATREQWRQAWEGAAQWARSPDAAARQRETVLLPLADWQLFFYREGAWANALSSGATNTPTTANTSVPEGVRLVLTLPDGGAYAGVITRDWVSPLVGGNKS